MALQHDCVSTFIHTPCATDSSLPWIPPHSHCASSQSLSLHLSCLLVLRLLRIRLVCSCLHLPRDILKTSLLIISRTSGWKECLAPGSHLQHCPSLLPLLVPFVVGPHGHAVTLFIKVGSFGLLVVASLFPCPSLLSKLAFKFSSANMLLFAYSYYL